MKKSRVIKVSALFGDVKPALYVAQGKQEYTEQEWVYLIARASGEDAGLYTKDKEYEFQLIDTANVSEFILDEGISVFEVIVKSGNDNSLKHITRIPQLYYYSSNEYRCLYLEFFNEFRPAITKYNMGDYVYRKFLLQESNEKIAEEFNMTQFEFINLDAPEYIEDCDDVKDLLLKLIEKGSLVKFSLGETLFYPIDNKDVIVDISKFD